MFISTKADCKAGPYPIWLWPTILSLDAPLVAVSWQFALAKSITGRGVPPVLSAALAVAVWSVYVLDRLLDGRAGASAAHLFTALHRKGFLYALCAVDSLAATFLFPALPPEALEGGLAIAEACLLYLFASQTVLQRRPAKPFLMGLLFSAGVVVPCPSLFSLSALLATAGVVWANLSLLQIWRYQFADSRMLRVYLSAGGVALLFMGNRYGDALALGCWLMLALDLTVAWVPFAMRRFLADAVLVFAVAVTG